MRYLLLALLVAGMFIWLVRRGKRMQGDGTGAGQPRESTRSGELMHQCAYCGIHVPASEIVASTDGSIFCCEEHRSRHGRQ